MTALKYTVVLAWASYALAGHVTNSTCPSTGLSVTCDKAGFNTCAGDSLQTNIIVRCLDSSNGICPNAGNCNDNLAGVPPTGVKIDAKCYQDSPTAGNAQCVFNCVAATKLDGSVFYPVGCTSASSAVPSSSASTPAWSSASPTHSHSHPSGGLTHSHHHPSSGYSQPWPSHSYSWGNSTNYHTKTHTKTSSTPGSVYTTSSTTYYTTTLPGGSVSTGSSVVPITTTSPGPLLSNNAMGREAQGIFGLIVAGLLALV